MEEKHKQKECKNSYVLLPPKRPCMKTPDYHHVETTAFPSYLAAVDSKMNTEVQKLREEHPYYVTKRVKRKLEENA